MHKVSGLSYSKHLISIKLFQLSLDRKGPHLVITFNLIKTTYWFPPPRPPFILALIMGRSSSQHMDSYEPSKFAVDSFYVLNLLENFDLEFTKFKF